MKILVCGGTHGNEQLGIDLVALLRSKPIPGVEAMIANPRAVAQNVRFTETDLNRSFGPQIRSSYEIRRAAWLTKKVARYDLVLDFHNTQTPDNDCCFVGEGYSPLLERVCAQFGFSSLVEATYDCINRYCLNTLSIEISVGGNRDSAVLWHQSIEALASQPLECDAATIKKYRYARRVTWEEKEKFAFSGWRPFEPLSRRDANVLRLKGEVVPIFIGSKFTEFYATVLEYRDNKQAYACVTEENM